MEALNGKQNTVMPLDDTRSIDKSCRMKLFVCCHRPVEIPNHPFLFPIQVGTALAREELPGFLHDNTGENISAKNRSYCELTGLYWMWKHLDADYCGLFHYRRFLYPDPNAKRPYRIEKLPTPERLDKLGYCDFEKLIRQFDLILPKGENMYVPVREHYAKAPFHHGKDLALTEKIVNELSPDYGAAMSAYLSGTIHYFGNIAIMSRTVLEDYCSWLFPILAEFDYRADLIGYDSQEMRVDGYLAERLLGVYYTKHQSELRTLELPRVHFSSGGEYTQKRLINALLPPGTRRRAVVKKYIGG